MFINKSNSGTITPASGAASELLVITHSLLKQMIVKSTTASTTFDLTLTDKEGNIVYKVEDVTGELNELPDIPTWGNLTMAISNASADEAFSYYFAFLERYD